jgi:flagellar hook-associated protein 3 FlgL
MRLSNAHSTIRYQRDLNRNYEYQNKLLETSDGSRLHRPSDDSVNYSKYLRYRSSSIENTQYRDNVQSGISWMKMADTALVNMKDIMITLNEKTIQAANGTNNTDTDAVDTRAIGKEYLGKVQELVSLANMQKGDSYLFGGQKDLEPPYTISAEKHKRGLSKTLDTEQAEFFGLEADGTGLSHQMLVLKGDDNQTYYLSTRSGKIYSEEFMKEGYKELLIQDQKHVDKDKDSVGSLSGSFDVSEYFEHTGELKKDPDTTISTSLGDMKLAYVEQYIVEYQGDAKHISMVKRNGSIDPAADTVNLNGTEIFGSNIFDSTASNNRVNGASSGTAALNDLLMVVAKMDEGDLNWLSSDAPTIASAAHAQLISAEAKVASRQEVYETVSVMLANQEETITSDISDASDTDISKLALDMMTMQTVYNMSLSVGGRILPQSLMDYLG